MSTFPIPYRFQSVNSKHFAISTKEDKAGQEVVAKPDQSAKDSVRFQLSTLVARTSHWFIFGQVLFTNVPIGPSATVVEITGLAPSRLYVSLKVSLYLTFLQNNCGLTNSGIREMPTKPNLLGPTRNITG